MDEKNDVDKMDDIMLPGFRFHPTDEELVGFYLKKKIQQRSLPIELIKQVDIYKYDPWDLPKLATTGEKEWYFYCLRDRKYRNSARPNRVTGAGFWKATGTDRPIYSSDGTKCIGLKKSLVFYRGRAAKGIKTDWMMHEFRLPSVAEPSPPKKFMDRSLPANDAWAICRIFKKANSNAQRALSHSWFQSLADISVSDMFSLSPNCLQFSLENVSCTSEIGSKYQICSNNDIQLPSNANFSALDIPAIHPTTLYKPFPCPVSNEDLPNNNFMFPTVEVSGQTKCTTDNVPSMLVAGAVDCDASEASEDMGFEAQEQQFNGFSANLSPQEVQASPRTREDEAILRKNPSGAPDTNQWEAIRSIGFPISLTSSLHPNLPWDSPSFPSEISTTYCENKCYT